MVAEIHSGATLSPTKLELLEGWIGAQRWYQAKGQTPNLKKVSSFRLDDPDGKVGLEVLFVRDGDITYQVPLTYRDAPLADGEGLIGTIEHSVLGTRYVYDGCKDPVFTAVLLATMTQGGREADRSNGIVEMTVVGHANARSKSLAPVASSSVLRGEQSNTSIIYALDDGSKVIAKVFRVLSDGANPDIEVTGALSEAGNTHVPQLIASLRGSYAHGRHSKEQALADLAFVQEFLPDVRDAWREALEAARENRDFTSEARGLGAVTAGVHRTLAQVLETETPGTSAIRDLVDGMGERARAAIADYPGLAPQQGTITARLEAGRDLTWPRLQRIHGDYHLGQVLDVPNRGWVLLDFEGEPLRPLAERSQPDVAVRDIAGMLRSFDYAGGTIEHEDAGADRRDWVEATQRAFVAGYEEESGTRIDADLLNLFVLDKALYEVSYEARNRPTWVDIPVTAVNRILGVTRADPADPLAATAPGTSSEPTQRSTMSNATPAPVFTEELSAIVRGEHRDPHRILGAHVNDGVITFRVVRPMARSVAVIMGDVRVDLTHEADGAWVGSTAGEHMPDYRVLTAYEDGAEHFSDDPYRFMPTLGDMDLHLINEGRHEQLWNVLGAHVRTYPSIMGDVTGTAFSVWAPNAKAVRVVGDFNHWDGVGHSMRTLGNSGVWELFVPDVHEGTCYKFEVLGSDGVRRAKADPMARLAETAPATASKVTSSNYDWHDTEWMMKRATTNPHTSAMSTYEVHLGSWRMGQSYRDMAEHLVNYVKDLGFTHVEFMPVMEHPYPPSWGYHVTSYYAPNSRFGDPDDFKYLVDRLHQEDIGVILDWVPGHFATDEWALARFDGGALYEHPDPRRGWHPEWGSNIFDYGRNEVRNFLVANALYWLEEFHADGLRVDGVASMIYLDYARKDGEWEANKYGGHENLEAVQLLQETNATAYKRTPGAVIIAEESTSWPGITRPTDAGGLGFGLKWNMGWMHDALDYFAREPVHRQYHHYDLTFALVYAFSEQFVLPISHDEVVHGKGSLLRKMPGDRWQQLANLRAFAAYQWAHPGKQLIFMGSEFAQESEWSDGRSLDWWLLDQPAHYGVHALFKDLNHAYRERTALWALDHSEEGFRWLNADDAGRNAFTWLRFGPRESDGFAPAVAVAANMSGTPHSNVRVGLPYPGVWNEIINTDAEAYGGSGVGNFGSVVAEEIPWDNQPYSAEITMPPLGVVWFEPASRFVPATPAANASAGSSSATNEGEAVSDSELNADGSFNTEVTEAEARERAFTPASQDVDEPVEHLSGITGTPGGGLDEDIKGESWSDGAK